MSRVVVVKVGGAQLIARDDLDKLTEHIRGLREAGDRPVVVHGGGPEIASLHERLGVDHQQTLGLRVTSDESIDLVTMVLCGLVNKRVVAALVGAGLPAVGLCGADLGLLRAGFINERALGRVGGPPRVDRTLLDELLIMDRVPVIAPLSVAPDGGLLNVNADAAAQAIAVAVGADGLELLTDVPAVRVEGGLTHRLRSAEVAHLVQSQVVTGGMIPKLQASVAAVDGGVASVLVGSIDSVADGTATEVRA